MTASNFNPPDRLTQTLLRDCLYENRDEIKNGTERFLSRFYLKIFQPGRNNYAGRVISVSSFQVCVLPFRE